MWCNDTLSLLIIMDGVTFNLWLPNILLWSKVHQSAFLRLDMSDVHCSYIIVVPCLTKVLNIFDAFLTCFSGKHYY